jgi:hypothetical protein
MTTAMISNHFIRFSQAERLRNYEARSPSRVSWIKSNCFRASLCFLRRWQESWFGNRLDDEKLARQLQDKPHAPTVRSNFASSANIADPTSEKLTPRRELSFSFQSACVNDS